jgi:hypothetical protein
MDKQKMKIGWILSIITCLAIEISIILWNYNINKEISEENE